jgi:hypothetical protein
LAVIRSGRIKALGFGIGFVAGQLLSCAILVAVGAAAVPEHDRGHSTLVGLLGLGFGSAVLWFAFVVRHRPPRTEPRTSARSQAALERLGRLRPGTAVVAGLLLGIGGPKRLVVTALAATVIATSGVDDSRQTLLVVWYTAIATVLAWVPILAFELLGDRALTGLESGQRWLAAHQRQATFVALLAVGLIALVSGLISLL